MVALPVVGYSETTGLQLGATAFRTFRTSRSGSNRSGADAAYFARTTDGYSKAYAQSERFQGGGQLIRARIEYISYPLPYFGIGPASPVDAEEWYSNGVTTLHVVSQRHVAPGYRFEAGYRLIHTRQREFEEGGLLALQPPDGAGGGVVSELRAGLVRDTRDNALSPHRGTFARLLSSLAAKPLGSGFSYRRLTLDARHYAPLARGFTAALQAQFDLASGSVPFDQLPMLGADSAMRGYPRGRFRDQHAATTQVEVRTSHWKRMGAVIFAGAGTVAPRASRLTRGPWHPTAGIGLRYLISPADRFLARIDLALGRRSVGMHVGLGEAF